ncbi:hypothetical protein E2I00_018585, partial [Balaenoptera physalus]
SSISKLAKSEDAPDFHILELVLWLDSAKHFIAEGLNNLELGPDVPIFLVKRTAPDRAAFTVELALCMGIHSSLDLPFTFTEVDSHGKTGLKVRDNSQRRHWRRTKLG